MTLTKLTFFSPLYHRFYKIKTNPIKPSTIKVQQISNCNIWQKPQVVVPRNEVKKCDNEIIKVSAESPEAHKNDRNHYDEKCNQEDEAYKEKAPAGSVKTPVSEAQQQLLRAAPPLQLGGVAGRKGSLTSECSSSTELDTPRHLARLASSARWDHSGAVGPDIWHWCSIFTIFK